MIGMSVRNRFTIDKGKSMGMLFRARLARATIVASFVTSFATSLLVGCASTRMYVDPKLPMYSESDLTPPAQLHPVNLVFEFQTGGRPNPGVTASVRPRIAAIVAQSGVFAATTPDADSGQLKVVINDIALTDNAGQKGMQSGLTMGIAASMVTDGYICTASYTRDGKTVQTTVRHELHTAIGNEPGPRGLEPKEPVVAIHWVIDQIAWNALKNLSDQHAFD
jgi:hypothetical protein